MKNQTSKELNAKLTESSEGSLSRQSYVTPDVDTIPADMVPDTVLGSTGCGASDGLEAPDCNDA